MNIKLIEIIKQLTETIEYINSWMGPGNDDTDDYREGYNDAKAECVEEIKDLIDDLKEINK